MSTPKGYDPSTGHMDFSLALHEMRKGRKVRRTAWKPEEAIWIGFDGLRDSEGPLGMMFGDDLLATDWEEA